MPHTNGTAPYRTVLRTESILFMDTLGDRANNYYQTYYNLPTYQLTNLPTTNNHQQPTATTESTTLHSAE